jgi:AcrR family transcriptional regulator
MAPSIGGDTSQYADTDKYVNTLEYSRTAWYPWPMHGRLTRQERKSQTREQLIDAAAAVFAQRGFEAATLDEVAAAAGYTKGAVYSNFASKTDLLIALIERRIEMQADQYAQRFEGLDLETATRALDVHSDQPLPEREWLILAVEFWLHAMRDERTRLLIADQYEHARSVVAGVLVKMGYGAEGREAPFEPREMAIVIEALGTGLSIQAALDPEHVRMGLVGEVLVKLFGLPALPMPESVLPMPESVLPKPGAGSPGPTPAD